MLTILGPRQSEFCDGLSRRDFLQVGALGGLTLADLLRLKAQGADRSSGKAVIMVILNGGPSHIDLYDLKPDASREVRGEYKPIQTNVPGIEISERLPLQAKIADQLAIVRNMKFTTGISDHYFHELTTGFPRFVKRPALGSVVSRVRGAKDVPAYVSLLPASYSFSARRDEDEDPAYLGPAHRPFVPSGPGLENLRLAKEMTIDRLADRKELLRSFDNLRRDLDVSGELAAADTFAVQALDIVSSGKARAAFDVSREPEQVKMKYGKAGKFLQARRLVEAGVSVVTLMTDSSWDHHDKIFDAKNLPKAAAELDQGLYALITDLRERGLAQDVAVVVWGEFGRHPRISPHAGREHWIEAGFTLIAGGGLRMGQVIGKTDRRAERIKDGDPYIPQNVLATLYHVLGIDPAMTFPDHAGRPMYVLDEREPIKELL